MKRSRILSIILVLGLALTGCSTTKAQKVTIELESNPTTGYEWDDEQKEVSGEEIFEIEDEMIPSESDELGAPGVQKFVLSPEHAGSTVVDFYYGREWKKMSIFMLCPMSLKSVRICRSLLYRRQLHRDLIWMKVICRNSLIRL